MARIRMIKPDFFDDPQIAELTPWARLFFIGLWTQADRAGRLVDDVRRLKARIFPYDQIDVEALAVELHGKDLIRRYPAVEKHGSGYIWIRSFAKHQRPHPKEPPSVIPEWTAGAVEKHGEPRKNTASPQSNGTRNLESGTRNEEGSAEVNSAPPPAPSVLHFPVVGSAETDWLLTEAQVAVWVDLFPGLDVCAECRKALAWTLANPGRRKTAKGMNAFLARWLTKAVDERRSPMPGAAQPPANRPQTSPAVAEYWDTLGKVKAHA